MHVTTFKILALLNHEDGTANELFDRIGTGLLAEPVPSLPGFYRGLQNAVDEGWVAVVGQEEIRGRGRPKKVFGLTDAGREAVEGEAKRLQDLSHLVLQSQASRG